MKNLILAITLILVSLSATAQTKKLFFSRTVECTYYGSFTTERSSGYHAVYNPVAGDKLMKFADAHPGNDSTYLVYNYGKNGVAYKISGVPDTLSVFVQPDGDVYALICGNLLESAMPAPPVIKGAPIDTVPAKEGKNGKPGVIEHNHKHSGHITHSWVDDEEEYEEEIFLVEEPAKCPHCHKFECICGGVEFKGATTVRPNSYVLHSNIDHLDKKDERYYMWNGQDWVYDPIPHNCRRLGCKRDYHVCGSSNYVSNNNCGHSYHQGGQCNGSQSGQYYKNGSGNYPRCHYERRGGVRVKVHVHIAGAICIR